MKPYEKRITWRIKNALFRITHPSFWVQNYPTDYEYDYYLNKLMDEKGVPWSGGAKVSYENFDLWVCNWPYAYGTTMDGEVLPAPLTRVRVKRESSISFIKKELEKLYSENIQETHSRK